MFVFPRSALPVVLPLALLLAVVLWSNRGRAPEAARVAVVEAGASAAPGAAQPAAGDEVLAANLPSR
jgi:hypothetical protein